MEFPGFFRILISRLGVSAPVSFFGSQFEFWMIGQGDFDATPVILVVAVGLVTEEIHVLHIFSHPSKSRCDCSRIFDFERDASRQNGDPLEALGEARILQGASVENGIDRHSSALNGFDGRLEGENAGIIIAVGEEQDSFLAAIPGDLSR